MHRRSLVFLALGWLLLVAMDAGAFSAASPEEVGLSTERLARIGQALTHQIEARSFPGAVALVMRKGRVAYFETCGQLDPQTGAILAGYGDGLTQALAVQPGTGLLYVSSAAGVEVLDPATRRFSHQNHGIAKYSD